MSRPTPPSASGWRLAAPAAAASLLPLAARLAVWAVAPGRAVLASPGLLLLHMVWAAVPFAVIAGLAATTARVRPAFGLAIVVGLALTVAGWGWAAWGGIQAVTGQATSRAGIEVGILMLMLPLAVVSVMITVIAVRSAFSQPPARPR